MSKRVVNPPWRFLVTSDRALSTVLFHRSSLSVSVLKAPEFKVERKQAQSGGITAQVAGGWNPAKLLWTEMIGDGEVFEDSVILRNERTGLAGRSDNR